MITNSFTPWSAFSPAARAHSAPAVLDWLQSVQVVSLDPEKPRHTYNRANYLRRKLRQANTLVTLPLPSASWFGLGPDGPCWHGALATQPETVITRAYLRLLEELTTC